MFLVKVSSVLFPCIPLIDKVQSEVAARCLENRRNGSACEVITRDDVNYTQGQALRLPNSTPAARRSKSYAGSLGI